MCKGIPLCIVKQVIYYGRLLYWQKPEPVCHNELKDHGQTRLDLLLFFNLFAELIFELLY